MARTISIGGQDFKALRDNHAFYVDKTAFIKEWWDNMDCVTLITRPRRFGKTLTMSMLDYFFSNRYAGRGDLFEGLDIYKEEKFRLLQGTYPVIFLTFAGVKGRTYKETVQTIKIALVKLFSEYDFLMDEKCFNENERKMFEGIREDMDDVQAELSLNLLSTLLEKYYGKKVLIFLDEYDTPLQEAYVQGYWEEMTAFIRTMFNNTFKTNPSMERAVMTGITRVSKESIFSDLNNLEVVTTTEPKYAASFGFTEEEVFAALDEFGISDQKEKVKSWYDGFTFGTVRDIYNPWSITKYLEKRKYDAYWANTSSNALVSTLIKQSNNEIKQEMERLMAGECIEASIDEEIVFDQLGDREDSIWSLLLAGGYLRIEDVREKTDGYGYIYRLKLTNREVEYMFTRLFADWFRSGDIPYNRFVKAMLAGNVTEMNLYMSEILLEMVSSFDAAGRPSGKLHPERFYHGLVLGLMATEEKYEVRSNGESGYGRYDITMVPKRTVRERGENLPSFVIEFKLFHPGAPDYEKSLEDTVKRALAQIEEKAYDTALLTQGIPAEQIRHYGFAFRGKEVLIG